MTAIGPGDVVECINNRNVEPWLTRGHRYVIAGAIPHTSPWPCQFDGCWDDGLAIEGIVHNHPGCPAHGRMESFCIHRFRPIYRRKAGAFDHLLKTTEKERERETV